MTGLRVVLPYDLPFVGISGSVIPRNGVIVREFSYAFLFVPYLTHQHAFKR